MSELAPRLGISLHLSEPEEVNLARLSCSPERGVTRAFTSLQVPEDDVDDQPARVKRLVAAGPHPCCGSLSPATATVHDRGDLMPLFRRSTQNEPTRHDPIEIMAPAPGRLLVMDDVPDPVFARKTMGGGFAVDPTSGGIASPVAGHLILVAETLHAFAVRTGEGLEVLVHVGIDTVALGGDGFTARLATGDRVAAGDIVIDVDLDTVRPRVPSMVTPVIITSGEGFVLGPLNLEAAYGSPVLSVTGGQ